MCMLDESRAQLDPSSPLTSKLYRTIGLCSFKTFSSFKQSVFDGWTTMVRFAKKLLETAWPAHHPRGTAIMCMIFVSGYGSRRQSRATARETKRLHVTDCSPPRGLSQIIRGVTSSFSLDDSFSALLCTRRRKRAGELAKEPCSRLIGFSSKAFIQKHSFDRTSITCSRNCSRKSYINYLFQKVAL